MSDGAAGRPPVIAGTHRGNAHPLYPPSLGAIPLDPNTGQPPAVLMQ